MGFKIDKTIAKRPTYKIEIEEFAECTCYSCVCKWCGERHNVYY